MFPSIKNINFFKFSVLVLNPGTYVARQLLKKKLNSEQLFFQDFLNNKKHELFHMLFPDQCCLCNPQEGAHHSGKGLSPLKVQWEQLFTENHQKCNRLQKKCCCMFNVNPNIHEESLDITLTVWLLINMFPLSKKEKRNLEELRDQRNFYAHIGTAEIEKKVYDEKQRKLIWCIEKIAKSFDSQIKKKISEDIQKIINYSPLTSVCHQKIVELCCGDRIVKPEEYEEVTYKVLQKLEEFQKVPEVFIIMQY